MIGGTPVLPNDSAINGLATVAIPQQRGFALVGNTDCSNGRFSAIDGLACHLQRSAPDVLRIMLHPTISREMLFELFLRGKQIIAVAIKQHGAGTGGALIDTQKTTRHVRIPSL